MLMEDMQKRSQLLQQEVQNSKLKVQTATEQLEASKAQLNMVVGHLNELNYQIQVAQDALKADAKEQGDGQTNDEGTQQAA